MPFLFVPFHGEEKIFVNFVFMTIIKFCYRSSCCLFECNTKACSPICGSLNTDQFTHFFFPFFPCQ
uniref:Uncharacterized protein n=1 Tax=Rhizophora mucronata TaxID=61149 RepID=A0A2P2NQY1_RHIMU